MNLKQCDICETPHPEENLIIGSIKVCENCAISKARLSTFIKECHESRNTLAECDAYLRNAIDFAEELLKKL